MFRARCWDASGRGHQRDDAHSHQRNTIHLGKLMLIRWLSVGVTVGHEEKLKHTKYIIYIYMYTTLIWWFIDLCKSLESKWYRGCNKQAQTRCWLYVGRTRPWQTGLRGMSCKRSYNNIKYWLVSEVINSCEVGCMMLYVVDPIQAMYGMCVMLWCDVMLCLRNDMRYLTLRVQNAQCYMQSHDTMGCHMKCNAATGMESDAMLGDVQQLYACAHLCLCPFKKVPKTILISKGSTSKQSLNNSW